MYGHKKICRWIRHDLRTGTLQELSGYNTGEQTIQSYQSRDQSYDISNRAFDWSASLTTSETLEIPFGIAFENHSNGFVKSWNLKHNKFLTSTIQCNRNFKIMVNWSNFIACQTGLPRKVCKVQNDENYDWPTLRGSKPNQMDLKWFKI